MPPGAHDSAGPRCRCGQRPEPLLPLVAPDLEVDVDDVVVGDREAGEAIPDRERARLVDCVEAPDDPDPATEVLDAEGARRTAGLELGRSTRPERLPVLEDNDARDLLTATVRDLTEAVREAEAAAEGDGDRLLDGNRAVGLDLRADVRGDEVVGLRESRRGKERGREGREPDG